MAEKSPPKQEPKWRLYTIPGSQFSAKAMVALDSQQVPYEMIFVNLFSRKKRSKELPTGGHLVPEVEIPVSGSGASTPNSGAGQSKQAYRAVKESSDILQAIDDYTPSSTKKLYTDRRVRDADKDISSRINAYVLYFNHVSEAGWTRSIRAKVVSSIPVGPLANLIPLHLLYTPIRNSFSAQVKDTLGFASNDDLTDEKMTEGLIQALQTYNDSLYSDGSSFLFGHSHATAADCALYGMVSRFVTSMGDANLPPCLPDLFSIGGQRLARLAVWQQRMQTLYPMRWNRYVVDKSLV